MEELELAEPSSWCVESFLDRSLLVVLWDYSPVERLSYRHVQSADPVHVEHGEAAVLNFTEAPEAKRPSSAHTDLQLPIKAASGAATALCA